MLSAEPRTYGWHVGCCGTSQSLCIVCPALVGTCTELATPHADNVPMIAAMKMPNDSVLFSICHALNGLARDAMARTRLAS